MPRAAGHSRWRRWSLAGALALVSGILLLPSLRQAPRAEETHDLTLLFTGAVQGKIAPCG